MVRLYIVYFTQGTQKICNVFATKEELINFLNIANSIRAKGTPLSSKIIRNPVSRFTKNYFGFHELFSIIMKKSGELNEFISSKNIELYKKIFQEQTERKIASKRVRNVRTTDHGEHAGEIARVNSGEELDKINELIASINGIHNSLKIMNSLVTHLLNNEHSHSSVSSDGHATEITLPNPDEEQTNAINGILLGENVILKAVAGSGKTTTILSACNRLPRDKRVLILTYNALLKEESREKVNGLNLDNSPINLSTQINNELVELFGELRHHGRTEMNNTVEDSEIFLPKKASVEVHSYHAFGCKYYSHKVRNDYDILDIMNSKPKRGKCPWYDIIFIDEAQDIKLLYFKFILKILMDTIANRIYILKRVIKTIPELRNITDENVKLLVKKYYHLPQLIFIGDPMQTIFNFGSDYPADSRYMLLISDILHAYYKRLYEMGMIEYPIKVNEFHTYNISNSYRMTAGMATFINTHILNEPGFIVGKRPKINYILPYASNPVFHKEVEYITLNMFERTDVTKFLIHLFTFMVNGRHMNNQETTVKYNISDVVFLAPLGIKTRVGPVSLFINVLTDYNVPIYFKDSNGSIEISDEVIKNKILFTTFHSFKGLERKIIVIIGFDNYTEIMFPKNTICSWYVGATRATEKIYLLHHYSNNYRSHVKPSLLLQQESPILFKTLTPLLVTQKQIQPRTKTYNVTNLFDHVGVEILTQFNEALSVRKIKCKYERQNIRCPKAITFNNLTYEDIGYYYGIYATRYWQYMNEETKVRDFAFECLEILEKEEETMTRIEGSKHGISIISEEHKKILTESYTKLYNSIKGFELMMKHNQMTQKSFIRKFVRSMFKMIVITEALLNGKMNKCLQIENYNWVSSELASLIVRNMRDDFPDIINAVFEENVTYRTEDVTVIGRIDMIYDSCIYEIKIKQKIEFTDILQLAMYVFMGNRTVGYLYNVADGQKYKVKINRELFLSILNKVLIVKNLDGSWSICEIPDTDTDFINSIILKLFENVD